MMMVMMIMTEMMMMMRGVMTTMVMMMIMMFVFEAFSRPLVSIQRHAVLAAPSEPCQGPGGLAILAVTNATAPNCLRSGISEDSGAKHTRYHSCKKRREVSPILLCLQARSDFRAPLHRLPSAAGN